MSVEIGSECSPNIKIKGSLWIVIPFDRIQKIAERVLEH